MLIPDLTLTPGLDAALRACGDNEPLELHVYEDDVPPNPIECGIGVMHLDGAELSEPERIRVEGILAAHRAEPF